MTPAERKLLRAVTEALRVSHPGVYEFYIREADELVEAETKEVALAKLMKAGLVDKDGKPTPPYAPPDNDDGVKDQYRCDWCCADFSDIRATYVSQANGSTLYFCSGRCINRFTQDRR